MSSNSPASHSSSKAVTASSPQVSSAFQSQPGPTSHTENFSQRRPGGSGGFGAGSPARTALASPRNTQSSRRQHKGQKKPRFADEDALAESAAMRSTSSRKGQTSITHLMNFTLPPRPQSVHRNNHYRNGSRQSTWGMGSGYHAADKARYINANYRFIVDPRGDYRAQAVDADVHLDWNFVLQILASAQTQCSACPICLSTPVAPRMAKCGHIFCLPCLIRYMHSTDETKSPVPEKKPRWKKCPICWDSIYISETRPVRWFVGQEGHPPRDGDDVVLRLMMRHMGSTLALPRDGADVYSESEDVPWYFAAEVTDYARVMRGTEDYMKEQYDTEIEQIEEREKEDDLLYGDESEWPKKAVNMIREAQERIRGIGNAPSMTTEPVEKKQLRAPITFNESTQDVPEMYMIKHAASSGQSFPGIITSVSQAHTSPALDGDSRDTLSGMSDGRMVTNTSVNEAPGGAPNLEHQNQGHPPRSAPPRAPANNRLLHEDDFAYYFYQALLHYYLSPLDIRILKAAFGNFSSFPSTLLPRVDHVSTGHVIDDELRKRAKYLAHLPSGCEVGFLECDWTDVVAPEILKRFKPDIERRRKKNRDKEMREEKDRIRAEKQEEDQRWAAARRKRSSTVRESISEDDFVALDSSDLRGDISSSVDTGQISSSPPWAGSSRPRNGSAFATLASPSTSPVAPRTVWGTAAVAPSSPPALQAERHEREPEPDGWLQGWEQDLLQDVNLIAQTQSSLLDNPASSPRAHEGVGGKKKKGKKITLMSTNVRRGA
ncbi:MAG: hypothetical protein M1816_006547 [Peltula sp. TS41687]|nr:MAG: hypothetical protein M1816_006547 [Peltula sp. TS41687]